MRYFSLILIAFSLISCSNFKNIPKKFNNIPKIYTVNQYDNSLDTIFLWPSMLTVEEGTKGHWGRDTAYAYGYVNAGSFEVVIQGQYRSVSNFTGNFALAEHRRNMPFIINKNNQVILDNFDTCSLYETEDKKYVLALVGNYTEYKRVRRSTGGMWSTEYWSWDPSKIIYRIYNLTTGKLIVERDEQRIGWRHGRFLSFFCNYFTLESYYRNIIDIYEIKEDGSAVKSDMSAEEFIAKIETENNLHYKENEYRFYTGFEDEYWFNKYISVDIEKLKEQVPENLYIDYHYDRYYDRTTYDIKLIGDFSYPLLTYPLRDDILAVVSLLEKGRKDRGYKEWHKGIYNISKNSWVIPPIARDRNIYKYGEWFIFEVFLKPDRFYNIETKKIHINQFYLENIEIANRYITIMRYIGNREREDYPVVIEDY